MDYQSMITQRKAKFADKFSDRDLSQKFVKYFENGQRIKVETSGLVLTGTVGITTGWVPAFLLIRTTRSMGSPWVLSDSDKILAVKQGRNYCRLY